MTDEQPVPYVPPDPNSELRLLGPEKLISRYDSSTGVERAEVKAELLRRTKLGTVNVPYDAGMW